MPPSDDDLPLRPPQEPRPRLSAAPPWVALLSAWVGLGALVAAIIVPLLPGSRDPRSELEHAAAYSLADRVLPVPLYTSAAGMSLGIIVLYAMRNRPRPLEAPLSAQRLQAFVGIALSLLAAAIIYIWVSIRGPG
jgi:hypothetical protein